MYKKLEKIVISHLMIILFWGLLFKNNLLVKEGPILNAVSLILFFTLYGLIYTEISNKKITGICFHFGSFYIIITIKPNFSK